MIDVLRILKLYDRGVLTHHEVFAKLASAALEQPPEELAKLIPEETLEKLREWSATPPNSPDQFI